MSTLAERAPQVAALSRGKKRLHIFGVKSVYLLNNGWVAYRRAPRNGWRDSAYWSICLSVADFEAKRVYSGDYGTLERALHMAIRTQEGEFGDIVTNRVNPYLF